MQKILTIFKRWDLKIIERNISRKLYTRILHLKDKK